MLQTPQSQPVVLKVIPLDVLDHEYELAAYALWHFCPHCENTSRFYHPPLYVPDAVAEKIDISATPGTRYWIFSRRENVSPDGPRFLLLRGREDDDAPVSVVVAWGEDGLEGSVTKIIRRCHARHAYACAMYEAKKKFGLALVICVIPFMLFVMPQLTRWDFLGLTHPLNLIAEAAGLLILWPAIRGIPELWRCWRARADVLRLTE